MQICVFTKPHHSGYPRLHSQGKHHKGNWQQLNLVAQTTLLFKQARKGEADTTPDDILSMVKAQAQPPHRQAVISSTRD